MQISKLAVVAAFVLIGVGAPLFAQQNSGAADKPHSGSQIDQDNGAAEAKQAARLIVLLSLTRHKSRSGSQYSKRVAKAP